MAEQTDTPAQPQSKNIFRCFLDGWKNSFKYKGRSSRYEFWSFALINILLIISLSLLIVFNLKFTIFSTVYYLLSLLPMFALSVRRLHDINKSGWYFGGFVLVLFIGNIIQAVCQYTGHEFIWFEIVMSIFYLGGSVTMFVLFLKKGTETANNYGEILIPETVTQKIFSFTVAIVFVVLPILAMFGWGFYKGYKNAQEQNMAVMTLEQIGYMGANIMDVYSATGNYDGLNTETAISQKIIPDITVNENELVNPFGGTYVIEGKGKTFSIGVNKLPPQYCGSIAVAVLQSSPFDIDDSSCTGCTSEGCNLIILKK